MAFESSAPGLVPAALVVLAGLYVRARHADKEFTRRWLLFLFLVLVLLIGMQLFLHRGERYRFAAVLEPAFIGTLTALLVYVGTTPDLRSGRTIWMTLFTTLALTALMFYWWQEVATWSFLISAVTALVWQAWEWSGKGRWLALLSLAVLALIMGAWTLNANVLLMHRPHWQYDLIVMGSVFVWPVAAVVLAARLVYAGFAGDQPVRRPGTLIRLALVALLLLLVGDLIVTETVWDKAEDSLSLLPVIVCTAATAAAMLLAWALAGWRRLAALGFVTLVTLTAWYAFVLGSRTSPTELTEARADEIARALQSYHERQGHYPSRLADLAPFYLWRIPQPMIFRDQTWCYEGGEDQYRLGYVHQPGFGAPPEMISIRIPTAAGEPARSSWACDDALERARSLSPWR